METNKTDKEEDLIPENIYIMSEMEWEFREKSIKANKLYHNPNDNPVMEFVGMLGEVELYVDHHLVKRQDIKIIREIQESINRRNNG